MSMKIYTKKGDKGKTTLIGGKTVHKFSLPVELIGDLDELNACLGLLKVECRKKNSDLVRDLETHQQIIMQISALIASIDKRPTSASSQIMNVQMVRELEVSIDVMETRLPEQHSFVVPGGSRAAAWAHFSRTICRRAERSLVRFVNESGKRKKDWEISMAYINRLSDYLFVLGRLLLYYQGRNN